MATLHSTAPHFVRCIVPNEFKQSGTSWGHVSLLEVLRLCEVSVCLNYIPFLVFSIVNT